MTRRPRYGKCFQCSSYRRIKAQDRCDTCYTIYWASSRYVPAQAPAVHRMSDVDTAARRGTCAHCGPVTAIRSADNGTVHWRCGAARAAQKRAARARARQAA